jgi:hypothetical protein
LAQETGKKKLAYLDPTHFQILKNWIDARTRLSFARSMIYNSQQNIFLVRNQILSSLHTFVTLLIFIRLGKYSSSADDMYRWQKNLYYAVDVVALIMTLSTARTRCYWEPHIASRYYIFFSLDLVVYCFLLEQAKRYTSVERERETEREREIERKRASEQRAEKCYYETFQRISI